MRREVLVAGYTGRLGRLVATCLRDQHDITPRVLVRPAHVDAADWQPPSGMQVAVGDFAAPDTLDEALSGVDAVFLVSPVHPDMREREVALAQCAAQQPKPPHIVKISGLGTRLDSFVDSGRWHAEIERDLTALGLSATFLRPLFFMQNLAFQARSMREQGVLRGGIEDAPIAMVDARDIAEVAAAVLRGGSAIEGQAVTVTGAQSHTYEQVAAAAGRAFGKPVRYERQSLEQVRQALMQSDQPQWHIDILLQFNQAFMQGWGSEVSDTVSRVLGRAPRSLDAYLDELAHGAGVVGRDPFPS